jgi:hypothetical protein
MFKPERRFPRRYATSPLLKVAELSPQSPQRENGLGLFCMPSVAGRTSVALPISKTVGAYASYGVPVRGAERCATV